MGNRAGFVVLIVGTKDCLCSKHVPSSATLTGDGLDMFINYTDGAGKYIHRDVRGRDLLVRERNGASCFLDAQGRTMYVITLQRFVRRQSELTDAELQDLWLCGVDAVDHLHG